MIVVITAIIRIIFIVKFKKVRETEIRFLSFWKGKNLISVSLTFLLFSDFFYNYLSIKAE